MARPRPAATTATPARTPRKPAGRPKGNQPASARKARNGREAASRATTAKPNPFDEIARQVNADQEARDRAAGRDDLTLAVARSVDQAKAKPSGTSRAATKPATPTRPAKPTRPTKVQTKVRTKQPAKAKAKPKQLNPEKAPTITLGHLWGDKQPDWLYRCTLLTRYEVRPDGTVWSTLDQVLGPDGKVVEDFWRLPLDYRPTQEVQGNGRKLVLKDRTIAGLQSWLLRAGLTTPEDSTT